MFACKLISRKVGGATLSKNVQKCFVSTANGVCICIIYGLSIEEIIVFVLLPRMTLEINPFFTMC